VQSAKCKMRNVESLVWQSSPLCTLHLAFCILHFFASAGVGQTSTVSTSASADQDNVIIVLDASGSMKTQMQKAKNKTRMQAAKEALLAVMRDLPKTTNVGLLVFSGKNLRNDWVYPLKPVDPQELIKAINLPQPDGGTPLGAYLKKGADALLKQRRAQHGFGTYRLLVVTDGVANDQQLVDLYLPDVLSRGITVDVIGVDMASDLSLATQVHSYRRADDPKSLVEAVKNVFAEVGSGSSDSASSAEDFALIAPIPDQMATAMVAALSRVADHPIGEAPPADPVSAATSPGEYDPSQPGLPPPPPSRRGTWIGSFFSFLGNLCFFGFIFLVIAAFVLIQLGRAAQRRNRR
jgi:uncharacterized protein YegL